ncbi:MAG TPA: hypothetical protein PKE55_06425 [Kiritimatiellia bacterium]|nr:hypothetical protein [Kiritimatiellia bacterium]
MANPDAKAAEVELAFLKKLSNRLPGHVPLLETLGHLYTESGRIAEGLEADLSLTRLCPDVPLYWYNLACSYALSGRDDEAFSSLDRAVSLGYRDVEWIRKDSDLDSIRQDPRFHGMLQRLLEMCGG